MQKTALTVTVTTLVLGIFGAFLHWLQLMNAFDKETGFIIPGAGTTVVFLIYCVLAAAAICALTALWLGRYGAAADAETALNGKNIVPFLIGWALCAVFAAASFSLLFSAGRSGQPMLQRIFGAFGIVAALSIPFLFGKREGRNAGPMGRSAALVITLFFCFWLVYDYKCISRDPIMWNYAVEILAIAASTVALYLVTQFFYGLGKSRPALILLQLGVFLNMTALFEERETALNLMHGGAAALQLLLEYLLISNLWEKRDEE